eukprot:6174416-Pleurochrysis_carterae.AAC.1
MQLRRQTERDGERARESEGRGEYLSRTLEGSMLEYDAVLLEAENALSREEENERNLRAEMQSLRDELVATQLERHLAQQECLRLRSGLRYYELRYPRAFKEPGARKL